MEEEERNDALAKVAGALEEASCSQKDGTMIFGTCWTTGEIILSLIGIGAVGYGIYYFCKKK
jgi:hypothetical protein